MTYSVGVIKYSKTIYRKKAVHQFSLIFIGAVSDDKQAPELLNQSNILEIINQKNILVASRDYNKDIAKSLFESGLTQLKYSRKYPNIIALPIPDIFIAQQEIKFKIKHI